MHDLNDYIKKSQQASVMEINQGKLLKTTKEKAEYRKETTEKK